MNAVTFSKGSDNYKVAWDSTRNQITYYKNGDVARVKDVKVDYDKKALLDHAKAVAKAQGVTRVKANW